MSGHSHWASIKRQKGSADAKRGQLFTKLAREITVAAREGGGDLSFNIRLRMAVQRAKDSNMPADNIDRAIKRATGGEGGAGLLEVIYEGYGPGGAAVLVQALTDNRNRTTSEVRTHFTRHNSNLAEAGSVTWLFERKGFLVIEGDDADREAMALLAADANAEDFKDEDGVLEVFTLPEDLESVRAALQEQGARIASSEVSLLPKTTVDLDQRAAQQALRLLEGLDELDDVQQVFTNANFPQDALEEQQAS